MMKVFNNIQNSLHIPKVDFNDYKILISLLLLVTVSIIINLSPRIYEKNIWDQFPSVFTVENEQLTRSGDPAYYINIAKYLKEGTPINDYYDKLYFPLKNTGEINVPLLPHIISYLAKDSSTNELVRSGNNLIFYSSILTTIGVFFLFLVIGRPFEGIIASVGSGISSMYLLRSSYGYIDTDMLNLFFMYFLYANIYLSSKYQSWLKTLCFIIAAGIVGKIFFLWYPKPELILLSFFSLVFFTIVNSKNWKKVFFNSFVYISITNPAIYLESLNIFINNAYLSEYLSANIKVIDLVNNTSLNFNNIFRYIGELQKPSTLDLFKLEGSIYLGLLCFTGIALWAVAYPLIFIGFAPLVFFFLLSLILGNRALFYSLPFLWFGLGYLTNFLIFKYVAYKHINLSTNLVYTFTSIFLIVLSVFITNSFNKKIDPTWISSKTIKGLVELGNIVEDKNNAVLVTDWGYGYQSILSNDIPVIIHPGVPTSPRHYFMARALTSFDEQETLKIINYIVGGNVERIKNKGIDNFLELSKDIFKTNQPSLDIYFMVTGKQRRWMASTGAIAYWDIENNRPYYFGDKTAYDVFNILEINCDDLDTTTYTTKCANSEGGIIKNIPVNLNLGLWDGKPIIKRVVQVENGIITINQEYKDAKGNFVFQIVKNLDDNTSSLYLMHEVVFKSTYNRLFHLNQYENYELVYEDYPYVKIYKIIN